MLVDLGHLVYVEDFETPFLAAAADFYAKEAQVRFLPAMMGCCLQRDT